MSPNVLEIVRMADVLTADERLELLIALLERTRLAPTEASSRRQLTELAGLYSQPMFGEDAQQAVNRLRDEWDAREADWRDTP